MKSIRDFIKDYSILSLSILFAIGIHLYYSLELWKLFETTCINKEFLTWDPELRFIITLKMMNDLRNFDLFQYISRVLDAPHWPSLRNAVESLLFFITSPQPKYVIFITYFFYLALPFSILTILWIDKFPPIFISACIFIFTLGLAQAESLQLYSFTGMMEVQGAFFFCFASYFLAKAYTCSDLSKNKQLGWLNFWSTTLLFHTKYPYGYLLVLCIAFIEIFLFSKSTLQYAKHYLENLKQTGLKNFRIWIVVLAVGLLFLPKAYLIGKLPNYLRYTIVLFLVLDLFIYFYKTPTTSENSRIHFLLKWIVFPILVWMLAQPDRFGSYSGQITHVESQGNNPGEMVTKNLDYYLIFVDEFLMNGFQGFALPFFLLFGNFFLVGYGLFQLIQRKTVGLSFFIALFCILTILELSLFTTNRLARHIYHLYPAMFLSLFFFIRELFFINKKFSFVVLTTFLGITAYPIVLNPKELVSKTEVCYTGYDPKDYIKPKWIEAKSKDLLKSPTIILNELSPYHVNKADAEYLVFRLAYERKIDVYFDPKRLKKIPPKWKELWILRDTCATLTLNQKEFWEENGFSMKNLQVYSGEHACILVIPRSNP